MQRVKDFGILSPKYDRTERHQGTVSETQQEVCKYEVTDTVAACTGLRFKTQNLSVECGKLV